jgi:hypothetical protein
MDISCSITNSLAAGTCNILYFRWVYSRSAGHCDNCYSDQVDYWKKTAQLIVAKNYIFAGNISDKAKSLLQVNNKGLLTKLYRNRD